MAEDQTLLQTLADAAERTAQALRDGRKLLIAGNGGSAADAQHLAAEFVGRLTADRPAMRAVALTTDTSILTSVTNDYGYAAVFRRQLEAIADPNDVFLAISTSGNSPNIVEALRYCRRSGIVTVGLTGKSGGEMVEFCDYAVVVRSPVTAHIQEAHLALEHVFSTIVEHLYFS